VREVPRRHWRCHGTEPLPTPVEVANEWLSAIPSCFLKITCDRCGETTMLNEAHTSDRRQNTPIRSLLARIRHDGCGGGAGQVELLTGIDDVSCRPVRRIILRLV
jgi:hypothetical protein